MIDAWAMTETGAGAVVIASHEPRRIGRSCSGRAQSFMQYRIVDQAGGDVADGTPGELWCVGWFNRFRDKAVKVSSSLKAERPERLHFMLLCSRNIAAEPKF